MTKSDFHSFCLTVAKEISYYSKAKRRQVGAVIAKDGNILAFGYNGTPSGFDNNCEETICSGKDYCKTFECKHPNNCESCDYSKTITKDDVVHAEENAIAKIAKSTMSCEGATMYITCAPCARCARLILQSGITEVYYSDTYHTTDGIEILKKGGIKTNYFIPILKH